MRVDFASGDVLTLTGEASIVWDGPEVARFARAQRLLRFDVTEGLWMKGLIPFLWSSPR
jgi:hypothetical protein